MESISNSHSASSQLSGEFMFLHAIHTLANLALKETVPPQSRISLHVTGFNTSCWTAPGLDFNPLDFLPDDSSWW